jgi:predicted XRE-type DNA-binding protein
MKRNKDFNRLTEEEIIARLENDNYEGGNIGLPENPTLEERTKYQLCKSILAYQQKNKLSLEKVAKELAISEDELVDICRAKINDFSVARLMFYLEKLTPNSELLLVDKKHREQEQAR